MHRIIERVGPCKMTYYTPEFQNLARSIVYQQLNGSAAATIFGRLRMAAKQDPLTPESVLRLRATTLRKAGLSAQKASYIRDLAQKTLSREVDFLKLPSMADDEVIQHLTRVKGIGVWTVQMLLMFGLQREDVLPTADFGIRKSMMNAFELEEMPKPAEMEQIAQPWQPYRTVACWYLWRFLDSKAGF